MLHHGFPIASEREVDLGRYKPRLERAERLKNHSENE
jgi:hypothetical protein